jgi:hypothetical protein
LVGVAVSIGVSVGTDVPTGGVTGVSPICGVLVCTGVLIPDDVGVGVGDDVDVAVTVAIGVSVTVGVRVWVGVLVGAGPTQLLLPETTAPSRKLPEMDRVEKLGPEIGPIVSQFGCAPVGGGGGFSVVGPPDPDWPPGLTL